MTAQGFTLNLCVRKPTVDVKYNIPNPIQINQKINNEQLVFPLQNLQEEVRQLNKQQRKKYLKIAKLTLLTSASILMVANPHLAFAQVPEAITVATTPDMIMPEDIMKAGLYLIGLTAALALVLSIILFQFSGVYRMLRKSKEATEWQGDIIRGLATTIIAPILMVVISFLAYLLFSGLPFFPSVL